MRMTVKDTSSGHDIREYECSRCGHTDWEDRGSAFWKILSEFNEDFSAAGDNPEPISAPGNQAESPEPQPELPQPEPKVTVPQVEPLETESEWRESWWDCFGSWMGWGR